MSSFPDRQPKHQLEVNRFPAPAIHHKCAYNGRKNQKPQTNIALIPARSPVPVIHNAVNVDYHMMTAFGQTDYKFSHSIRLHQTDSGTLAGYRGTHADKITKRIPISS